MSTSETNRLGHSFSSAFSSPIFEGVNIFHLSVQMEDKTQTVSPSDLWIWSNHEFLLRIYTNCALVCKCNEHITNLKKQKWFTALFEIVAAGIQQLNRRFVVVCLMYIMTKEIQLINLKWLSEYFFVNTLKWLSEHCLLQHWSGSLSTVC